MRDVREVLRLKTAEVSGNEIARRLNVAPSTVRLTSQRLATAGLGWPLPAEMTDTALEARRFTAAGTKQGHRRHAEETQTPGRASPAAPSRVALGPIIGPSEGSALQGPQHRWVSAATILGRERPRGRGISTRPTSQQRL
jgi:hypothetical protein